MKGVIEGEWLTWEKEQEIKDYYNAHKNLTKKEFKKQLMENCPIGEHSIDRVLRNEPSHYRSNNPMRNINETSAGHYALNMSLKGKQTYIGTFYNLEQVKFLRDKLTESRDCKMIEQYKNDWLDLQRGVAIEE